MKTMIGNPNKRLKYPWPHFVNEETKTVYTHVASGFPTVMAVPQKVQEFYPGYESKLVSLEYLEQLND